MSKQDHASTRSPRKLLRVKGHPGKHLRKDELTLRPDMPQLNPPTPNGMRWRATQSKSRISSRSQRRSTQAPQKCTRCPASCGDGGDTDIPAEGRREFSRAVAHRLAPRLLQLCGPMASDAGGQKRSEQTFPCLSWTSQMSLAQSLWRCRGPILEQGRPL